LPAAGEDDDEEVGSDDEGDDEENDDEEQPDILHRMLEYIGLAAGRSSKNKVSYDSMQQAMQADTGFTEHEKEQAQTLYGLDITEWAEQLVEPRAIKAALHVILKAEGLQLHRTQMRIGGDKISFWNLKDL
jgi:hypothetical protein